MTAVLDLGRATLEQLNAILDRPSEYAMFGRGNWKRGCSHHCGTYFQELIEARYYRLRAIGAKQRGDMSNYEVNKSLARVCHDNAAAFRDQIPHGYSGGLSYGYQPSTIDPSGRRMVVRRG